MGWDDLIHPSFRFLYGGSRGVHRAKESIHCSLDHLESLVRRREVSLEGLEQLAWAHMFMEGARQFGASFICV
jgi:hypothetical protein